MLFLSACGNANEEPNQSEPNQEEPGNGMGEATAKEVNVILKNTEGDNVGSAALEEVEDGVQIILDVTHLPPGKHGFHIHEAGACEEPDFKSAGGHFNPTDADHGFDSPDGPHAGDLPNIEVSEDGEVKEELIADMVTLEKDQDNSLLDGDGTSLVIHADADDNVSQPAGDAGDRIACGVIEEE